MKPRLAAFAALLMLALVPAAARAEAQGGDDAAPASPQQFYAEYSGSIYFLQVADISLTARLDNGTYSSAASFQSAGRLRWFDDTDIQASAIGYRAGEGLTPYRYEHVNRASDKGRVVGIDFPDATATPDINPPFGSMGQPPASPAERAGALDPITVILNLMLGPIEAGDEALCSGRLPVFDGKARYDLRFENLGADDVRTRAYRGPATRCQAFVEPISGYDPGDRPTEEEVARPVNIWLVEMDGVHIPVRFRAATQIGNISIEARRIGMGGQADG
jgi:hypothetical protein